jgi:hypothetical protein
MSVEKTNKLKNLLLSWVDSSVATSKWLLSKGITPQLAKKYSQHGWLTALGHGAYKKLNDTIAWQGALYSLQSQLNLPVHLGGLSALSFHGVSHYIRLGIEPLFLYIPMEAHLPKWFRDYDWGLPVNIVKTNFLPRELGLKTYRDHNFELKYASVERAILELLYLAPKKIDLVECYQIMIGLQTLRPNIVQALLEECHSVKVKRLFLFMADAARLPVMKHLNLEKIDLGKGERSIVSNGKYDAKYKLMLPNELINYE